MADDGSGKPSTTEGVKDGAFILIQPLIKVLDQARLPDTLKEFSDGVKANEPGCLFYDFCTSDDGALIVREAYVDVEAVKAHLQRAGPRLKKCAEEKIWQIEKIDIFCSAEQKKALEPYRQCSCWTVVCIF